MPIYDYECKKCHHRFELKKGFNEESAAKCPECKGKAERIITSVPVIFKGSGFYVTDHKKNNPASTPEKKTETPKPATDSKPAAAAKKD
ncbi:MAG: FmdB family zinc ribbon protein [Dehalococcoidales bacterium]|jgi:putative FmdB family regulatory protein